MNILNIEDKKKEECGVFGVFSSKIEDVAKLTYYGLYALQHRGEESSGISVSNFGEIVTFKGMGLAAEVFDEKILKNLVGNSAIGHVRYSTTGASELCNAQPLEYRCKLGKIAVAHNGNLINIEKLKEKMIEEGATFSTTIDSEVIINLIAKNSKYGLEEAIKKSVEIIQGAFSLTILAGNKLIGVRDPYGIRPLCLGKTQSGTYILSSESCAIDTIGGEFIRDICPGEIVIIDENGVKSIRFGGDVEKATCAFEYIYFARQDSVIDDISVYNFRVEAGKLLALQKKIDADMVIGVPDSGIPYAIGYAKESGIPFEIGLEKNRYIGRTFIKPTQELRQEAVMVKLNPLRVNVQGKRVIIIDDSLVRGTTSKILIDIIRKAGAKEVHFLSASPAVKYSCYFGIDTTKRENLIAAKLIAEEIRKEINADTLEYLSLENMYRILGNCKYCVGCFNGKYPMKID